MKALELARPTLPSISSSAPHTTHLPASEHHHGNLFRCVADEHHGSCNGDLEQGRVHLVEEDASQVETRSRFTCYVV